MVAQSSGINSDSFSDEDQTLKPARHNNMHKFVLLMVLGAATAQHYGGHSGYSSQSIHLGGSAHYAAPAIAKVAYAAPVAYHAPAKIAYAAPAAHKEVIDYYDPHPEYSFEYGVHDAHTGDVKEQKEERKGDVVHGSYSLVEPDGTKRVVEYTADHHNGFNAVVHRQHNTHPAPVHKVVAAPVYKSAPVLLSHGHHY